MGAPDGTWAIEKGGSIKDEPAGSRSAPCARSGKVGNPGGGRPKSAALAPDCVVGTVASVWPAASAVVLATSTPIWGNSIVKNGGLVRVTSITYRKYLQSCLQSVTYAPLPVWKADALRIFSQ